MRSRSLKSAAEIENALPSTACCRHDAGSATAVRLPRLCSALFARFLSCVDSRLRRHVKTAALRSCLLRKHLLFEPSLLSPRTAPVQEFVMLPRVAGKKKKYKRKFHCNCLMPVSTHTHLQSSNAQLLLSSSRCLLRGKRVPCQNSKRAAFRDASSLKEIASSTHKKAADVTVGNGMLLQMRAAC